MKLEASGCINCWFPVDLIHWLLVDETDSHLVAIASVTTWRDRKKSMFKLALLTKLLSDEWYGQIRHPKQI